MNIKQTTAVLWAQAKTKIVRSLLPLCVLGVAFTSGYLVKNSEEKQFEARLEDQRRTLNAQCGAQVESVERLQVQRMNERDARLNDQLARIEEQHQMIVDLQHAVGTVIDKQKAQIRAHNVELQTLKRTEAAAQKAATGLSIKDKMDINKAINGGQK